MNPRLTFEESIAYLDSLYHQPLVPASQVGLRRATYLLGRLGDPHRAFRAVHVAGSCGKGSTTTMVGSVLQATGCRTGYFRSPHLETYTERIRVNDADIDPSDWERCFSRVHPVVESMRSGSPADYQLGRPALFEVLFALMALYFAEQGVEWAAVETGLGGRLDATNLLEADVAIVTNVSLEHTQVLGTITSAIAVEKAAIIKPGSHAISAAQDASALAVIEQRAATVGARLLLVGDDVRWQVQRENLMGQRVRLKSSSSCLEVELGLAGRFQAANAATAFAAVLGLRERGVEIEDAAIVQGLESVRMPGRLELVSTDPFVILDGAHNPAAAHELRRAAEHLLGDRRIVLLIAAMADKDLSGIARELGPISDLVILTRVPGTERAAPSAALEAAFEPWTHVRLTIDDVDQALEQAGAELDSESVLLVTGSLYLVGHVRKALVAAGVPG